RLRRTFLGDETAWKLGRVSLIPVKHIDSTDNLAARPPTATGSACGLRRQRHRPCATGRGLKGLRALPSEPRCARSAGESAGRAAARKGRNRACGAAPAEGAETISPAASGSRPRGLCVAEGLDADNRPREVGRDSPGGRKMAAGWSSFRMV